LVNPLAVSVDVELYSGTIDVNQSSLVGKELIIRYSTSIDNGGYFYTDDSGMQMMKRQTNLKGRCCPQDEDIGVIIAGNYYPVVSRAYIRNLKGTNYQFTIVTHHSHGGGSLATGELEVMFNRRLLRDDNRGVDQPLNVTYPVLTRYGLLFANTSQSALYHRQLALLKQYPLQKLYTQSTLNTQDVAMRSLLTSPLSPNLVLLSLSQLEAKNGNRAILRLYNPFELGENPTYSLPASIDIATMFSGMSVKSIEERTLTTMELVNENVRPIWPLRNRSSPAFYSSKSTGIHVVEDESRESSLLVAAINVSATQIRTFFVNLSGK